jgi:hypothetical protein
MGKCQRYDQQARTSTQKNALRQILNRPGSKMSLSKTAAFPVYLGLLAAITFGDHAMAQQKPAITAYGDRHEAAPEELDLFSFLIGKWEGSGKTRLADGTIAEYDGLSWIGRYVLDGMAIIDELHAPQPDGSQGLGITLRYFDQDSDGWVVEFLNVSFSFIRRQVNARSGAVEKDGSTVVVTSVSDESISREFYRVIDDDSFVYTIDLSNDGGETWNRGSIEFTMNRVE